MCVYIYIYKFIKYKKVVLESLTFWPKAGLFALVHFLAALAFSSHAGFCVPRRNFG